MPLELTSENYFSIEANMEYMSSSQFKEFMHCEVDGLAKAKGEVVEEKSPALLFGGYVDSYFSNELERYIKDNPDMFTQKGELKAPYKNANEVIHAIESDPLMMKYLDGDKQVIMVGEIAGVLFKIKIDALHPDMIVDQKIIASIHEDYWVNIGGKKCKCDFIQAFGYVFQGAIYQEVVRQNIGKKLPFILAVTTKEDNPDKALIQIDQEYLDQALEIVKEFAPRFDLVKKGIIDPIGCKRCASCRKGKMVQGIDTYKILFNRGDLENDE